MTVIRAWSRKLWWYCCRLSKLDIVAAVLAGVGLLLALAGAQGGAFSFLKFLGLLGGAYLAVRLIGWSRTYLLWSLRNRLIVAYVFIAVVPIFLILILVGLAGRIVYSQLGAYLLYEDIHERILMISDIGDHIAAAHATLPKGISEEEMERVLAAQSHAVHDRELPGLTINFSSDDRLLRRLTGPAMNAFSGLLQEDDKLSLTSIRAMAEPYAAGVPSLTSHVESKTMRVVTLRVPVTPEFLRAIAPDLGAIQLSPMERYAPGRTGGVIYTSGDQQYVTAQPIIAKNRTLQPPAFWFDAAVEVVSRLDAAYIGKDEHFEKQRPVLAVFNARPSQLNARIFTSLGELRTSYLFLFAVLGIVFLLIEIAALVTGIVLTRRITHAVADLYHATQFIESGDFAHKVKVQQRDQLGRLGESFNKMTESISNLIE